VLLDKANSEDHRSSVKLEEWQEVAAGGASYPQSIPQAPPLRPSKAAATRPPPTPTPTPPSTQPRPPSPVQRHPRPPLPERPPLGILEPPHAAALHRAHQAVDVARGAQVGAPPADGGVLREHPHQVARLEPARVGLVHRGFGGAKVGFIGVWGVGGWVCGFVGVRGYVGCGVEGRWRGGCGEGVVCVVRLNNPPAYPQPTPPPLSQPSTSPAHLVGCSSRISGPSRASSSRLVNVPRSKHVLTAAAAHLISSRWLGVVRGGGWWAGWGVEAIGWAVGSTPRTQSSFTAEDDPPRLDPPANPPHHDQQQPAAAAAAAAAAATTSSSSSSIHEQHTRAPG